MQIQIEKKNWSEKKRILLPRRHFEYMYLTSK